MSAGSAALSLRGAPLDLDRRCAHSLIFHSTSKKTMPRAGRVTKAARPDGPSAARNVGDNRSAALRRIPPTRPAAAPA